MEIRLPERAGCAGIAAAVSAARHGCRVVLLERWPTVGGMATNALVNGWHRSDREKMVIYGLVEESARLAEPQGWIRRDPQYPHAHETHWFEPEGMRIVWHRMLEQAGVRTFCNLAAGDPVLEAGRLRAVLCDTKCGRAAVTGAIFIDATGDGDLAAKAGAEFHFGRPADGRVQGMTLMFGLHGIDAAAVRAHAPQAGEAMMQRMRELNRQGAFPPFNDGNAAHYMQWADDRTLWNMLPVAGNPLDEEEMTRLTVLARERLVAYLELWRRELPGYAQARIDRTGFALGVRESRRIRGRKTLDADMVLGARKHPDAVGHGVWMIDIHDPCGSGHTTYTDHMQDRGGRGWVPQGQSYHIPLGMALNPRIPNLAVVGRCASSTHEAHSSFRVQTHCMVLGQGAGTAAALALHEGCTMDQLSLPALQTVLRADGVYLEDVPAE
ncbi:MAG: putative FAD-binding dehydrogenase [Lentisphaerae bacterium ADurb.BinA184]|nr:MAG: putative FAD-binding dehydrogenase [Lentisphaerae bacterium ADurb.BinA184]